MRPPLIQRPGRKASPRHREQGVTLALVALAIFSVIAMAGLSIDVGTLYQSSAEAQRAADAAALAAARVLSASGLTGDPGNSSGTWSSICTSATQIATEVANQNLVGGAAPSSVVSFNSGDKQSDCTAPGGTSGSFGVNPTVTVQVSQTGLSTYFARIWGRRGTSVSATATAEAFNPSNSSGALPVLPRCVKPWVLPNYEPWNPTTNCNNTNCKQFVDPSSGAIHDPGVVVNNATAVIGQTFTLTAACKFKDSTCVLGRSGGPQQPVPNVTGGGHIPSTPNLEYLPGQVPATSSAQPNAVGACSDISSKYAEAIAGCDQSTQYKCGVKDANFVDSSENPGPNDTPNGTQCLIHQGNGTNGQDTLQLNGALPPVVSYPFQIQAGTDNPLVTSNAASSGEVITSSNSIATLPIYDSAQTTVFTPGPGTTPITIIGFLQVFINSVDNFGNVNVTVMNVSGCGNAVAAGTASLNGTSPVPIRLITPP